MEKAYRRKMHVDLPKNWRFRGFTSYSCMGKSQTENSMRTRLCEKDKNLIPMFMLRADQRLFSNSNPEPCCAGSQSYCCKICQMSGKRREMENCTSVIFTGLNGLTHKAMTTGWCPWWLERMNGNTHWLFAQTDVGPTKSNPQILNIYLELLHMYTPV